MLKTLLRLGWRNTLRNRVRTSLTIGMVTAGVALLLVALTWTKGIFDQMLADATSMSGHVRLVDPDFAAREALMPLYENVATAPLLPVLEGQPGVVAALPRIMAGVTVTVGEEIGDVFALAVGAPERYYRDYLRVDERLSAGRWLQPGADELVMGARVARQVGAKLGDEVVLLGATQYGSMSPVKGKLVGIVRGGGNFVEQQIFMSLAKMQWLTDMEGSATEVLVYGSRYQDAPALAAGLRGVAALAGTDVRAWSEREPWVSLMATMEGMQRFIVLIIVFLTALGIWNTMMMSVLERTHEIGVMRAMGLSGPGAVSMLVLEATAIGVLGGAVGLALGAGPAWLLESRGVHIGEKLASKTAATLPMGETIRGDLTGEIMLMAFLLGLLTAVLGSLLPAVRAARIQPITAMRAGR